MIVNTHARMHSYRCSSKPEAFTLIELLVVVAIIAALISILLPSLNKARETARRVLCGSNQRQIAISMTSYSIANRDAYPYHHHRFAYLLYEAPEKSDSLGVWNDARTSFIKYGGTTEIHNCPGLDETSDNPKHQGNEFKLFQNGSGTRTNARSSFNIQGGFVSTTSYPQKEHGKGTDFPFPLVTIKTKPDVPIVMDLINSYPSKGYGDVNTPARGNHADTRVYFGDVPGANYGFADGHVVWRDSSEIRARVDRYKATTFQMYIFW